MRLSPLTTLTAFTFSLFLNCCLSAVQPSSSSKALNLAQSAEMELAKETPAAIQRSIEILESVVKDPSFRPLDIDKRLRIFICLSLAYQKTGKTAEQDELIKKLLDDSNYRSFWVHLKVHLTESYISQGRIEEAHELFRQLMREPKRKLAHQDREEIATLSARFEAHYEKLLAQAEKLYSNKHYAEAVSLHQIIQAAVERRFFPHTMSEQSRRHFLSYIQFRVASSHFLAKAFNQAIAVLTMRDTKAYLASKDLQDLYWQGTFLQALSYKNLGRYEEAHELFSHYLESGTTNLFEEALWEACFSAIKAGKLEIARLKLERLTRLRPSHPQAHSTLRLQILLEIEQQNYDLARTLLETSDFNQRHFENHYLKGYLSFRQRDLEQAIINFEKSLPNRSQATCEWADDALYFLGLSYLKIAQSDKETSLPQRLVVFERAESCFQEIIAKDETALREPAFLGLGTTLFYKSKYEKSSAAKEKLEELCRKAPLYCSDDVCYEIALFVAQTDQSYSPLLHPRYRSYRLYPEALFLQAKLLLSHAKESDGKACLFDASKWLSEYENSGFKKEDLERSRWLHCQVLYEMGPAERVSLIFELYKFLSCHPQSRHTAEARYLLGLVFWQQKKYSQALEILEAELAQPPDFPRRDEVLFFAASSGEHLGKIEYSSSLYSELFSRYPSSPYAAESYFRYYSEQEYLAGNPKAISHLKNMPEGVQSSPFAAIAAFYVASNLKQQCPEKPITEAHHRQLQEAISYYDQVIEKSRENHLLQWIFLQAQLERGRLLFVTANSGSKTPSSFDECEKSLENLKRIIEELVRQNTRCHAKLLALWQESTWLRSRVLTFQGKDSNAREELVSLLQYSEEMHFLEGAPLVKGLCELATTLSHDKLFEQARSMLAMAEQIQAKGLSRELLLEVWIAKAKLYCKKQQYDKAMGLLSLVINETFASSLRVQAMYLRAEVYELKGRRDLAIRQLEACAKKGGEWAHLAATKLEGLYGYE